MQLSTDVKEWVIVTRLGDFWVSAEKAKSIASGMDDKAGKASIDEVGIISMSQVYAVLTRKGYEVYQKKQSGKWECNKGTWHEKFSKCDCRLNVAQTPIELGLTEDSREAPGPGYAKYQEMREKMGL